LTGSVNSTTSKLPSRDEIREHLLAAATAYQTGQVSIDTITFAGNGEPTMHPKFSEIVDDTIAIRDTMLPGVKVAVLSNASLIHKPAIREALKKTDMPILKFDSAIPETVQHMNCPGAGFSLEQHIGYLHDFGDNLIIQSLFLQGTYNGRPVDNTTTRELEAWYRVIENLHPSLVMIYTIERDTPVDTLAKIPENTLKHIATNINKMGIETAISS
jgi:wyosine [tRNA(Phe)-imidazoG37] synthetase (radical SAM superfamily)